MTWDFIGGSKQLGTRNSLQQNKGPVQGKEQPSCIPKVNPNSDGSNWPLGDTPQQVEALLKKKAEKKS